MVQQFSEISLFEKISEVPPESPSNPPPFPQLDEKSWEVSYTFNNFAFYSFLMLLFSLPFSRALLLFGHRKFSKKVFPALINEGPVSRDMFCTYNNPVCSLS